MNWRAIIVVMTLVSVGMAGAVGSAERGEPLADKIKREQQALEKLKSEIKEKQQKSEEAERQEQSVLQSIEDADHRLKLRRDGLARIKGKLKEKDREREATSSALEQLRRKIEQRQSSIRSRLQVMYKDSSVGQANLLVDARDSHELLDRLAMLWWISRREFQMLESYRADQARLESTDARLQRIRGELLAYQEEHVEKLAQVRQERTTKDRLLARVRNEKALYLKAVTELEKSAHRIEGLLSEFEARRKAMAGSRIEAAGNGLARLKGQLGWPSEGEVVGAFGRQKHPKFDTYVQRKGIEIRAAQGSVIRAVSDGVVAFADWMKGYGLLAIVDHGEGYFSLYAHASKLLVNVGDPVRGHQPIGEIGDTGLTAGNTLYFELRQGGAALDPLNWLAKK